MNITYIIGTVAAFVVMVIGMILDLGALSDPTIKLIDFGKLMNFIDPASIFIVIGCTFAVLIASFPGSALKAVPKHFAVMMNTKRYDPMAIIDKLVELAQVARKNGLLALEEMANQESDPFFKQCIMLIVDNNDADQAKEIMMNDIEQSVARHEDAAGIYDKSSAVAPAFGMVGTLVGLINMLKAMDVESGGGDLGPAMATALITTLYGCILAHMLFGPIATQLRRRDEEETLCKLIIVEGIMSIQGGANPKFLREKLLTFMGQKQRSEGGGKKEK